MADIPALPQGFVLDNVAASMPALPEGFVLDRQSGAEAPDSGPPKQDVDLATRAGMAMNRNVIAPVLGAPVDAATWAINKVGRGVQSLTGAERKDIVTDPIGGSESIKKGIAAVGRMVGVDNANPDSATPATTLPEKIAEGVGEGVGMAVLPGLGAEAMLARSVKASESLGSFMLNIIKGGGAASNAAMGGAGGAVGVTAEEMAPEPLKPLARMGGEMLGGVGVAAAESLGRAGVSAAGRGAREVARTAFEPAEMEAGRRILSRAENPAAFRQSLAEATDAELVLPGSKPTTFQATGDMGVGALEREVQQRPGALEQFRGRATEQNEARVRALEGLADPNADPRSVGDFLRTQLDNIEAEYGAKVAAARQEAQARLGQTGGDRFQTDADYGSGLRTELETLDNQRKAAEDRLWEEFRSIAGDKPIPIAEFRKAVAEIEGSIGRLAKQPKGEEAEILATIRGAGDYATFGEIKDLRSQITDALRNPQDLTGTQRRRLSQVLERLDGTLDDAVSGPKVGDEVQWTSNGSEMFSEPRKIVSLGTTDDGRRFATVEGSNTGLPVDELSVVRPGGTAALTPDDVAAYDAARTATRERKETFGTGAVGAVLKPGPQTGTFRTTESNVVGRLLKNPEDLRNFVNAAGDSPEAMAIAQDALAFDMRKKAVKDGILLPSKLQGWVAENAEALRQFPDLQARFANARAAQETLDSAIERQTQAVKEFQTAAVKKLLADADPVAAVGSAMKTPESFGQLVETVRADPQALAGLKRAAVEWMLSRGLSTAEAGTSGVQQIRPDTLQRTFLNSRAALGKLFSPEELKSMAAVTADLQRAMRSQNALRIPGQSNTAQDQAGNFGSALRTLFTQHLGKGAAVAIDGGATSIIGGAVVDAMRTARMNSVDRAVAEMMLDPKMANLWISKLPQGSPEAVQRTFARRLKTILAQQVARELEAQE